MNTLDIFDPNEAFLKKLVGKTQDLTATDLEDPAQLKVVKTARITLRDARVKVEKAGKAAREDALKYQKDVLAKERELIAIIEPEENRLKSIEEEAKMIVEKKYRLSQFEARSARLEALAHTLSPDLNAEMDDAQFEAYFQNIVTMNNERRERELKAREDSLKQAELAVEREKELKAREEQARADERARSEREAIYAKEKAERDVKEANERTERAAQAEREKIAREEENRKRKEAEAQKKLELDTMYQTFLESHGWNDSVTFHIERKGETVLLYKLVGTLELE